MQKIKNTRHLREQRTQQCNNAGPLVYRTAPRAYKNAIATEIGGSAYRAWLTGSARKIRGACRLDNATLALATLFFQEEFHAISDPRLPSTPRVSNYRVERAFVDSNNREEQIRVVKNNGLHG